MKHKELLKKEIYKNNYSIMSISKELKINSSTFFRKLNKEGAFTIAEVQKLWKVLNLTHQQVDLIFFDWIVA